MRLGIELRTSSVLNPRSKVVCGPESIFVHDTDRLWFVERDGRLFAVMARTSDDAISAVEFLED